MRPGKRRDAATARELAEEARTAARDHGLRRDERDELERDVESVAGDRQFAI